MHAKFLLTVWPWETHIHPNLALGRVLQRRGHQVAFYSGESRRGLIEAQGFQFFPFQKLEAAHVERLMDSLLTCWNQPWCTHRLWRRFLCDTVPAQLEDLESILRRCPPDVIVSDMAMWGPPLVLREAAPIPVAVLAHIGYCMLPGRQGMHPGVPVRLGGARARIASRVLALATRGIRQAMSRVRIEHGLAPLCTAPVESTGQVPLYLVPSVPELDARRDDVPASVRYIGACLWEDPGDPAPAVARQHGACVLVIEGGLPHGPQPWLLEMAARALAGQPATVYLVRSRQRAGYDCRPAAPNLHILDAGHLGALVSAADVVVTHGSSEVVVAALSKGIPLVMVPAVADEPHMAWRAAQGGAGVRMPRRRCTPERLRAAVMRVLREPGFRRQAQRLQQAFAAYGGPELAAGLLEELVCRSVLVPAAAPEAPKPHES